MIYCAFVGPFKDKRLKQMIDEYHRRLEHLWPVTLVEISEKTKEIHRWIDGKKAKGILVSLDAHGEEMESATFTRWVTKSSRDIIFLGWGADGPPDGISDLGLKSLSLSRMTYTHEMARVLLIEQLYRAGATLKGHPYPR